jgi:hypothetical protein
LIYYFQASKNWSKLIPVSFKGPLFIENRQ